ncbi:MAG: hypothetical protein D6766_07635, partial [Verrucomicrobia bacterium]
DEDDPPQQLTFTLTGAPEGAALDPQTGVFTWTPTEAQGPGAYPMTITVTDDGTPPRSDAETFTVTVLEVNRPPVIPALTDRTIDEGQTLTFVVGATDPDLPANGLTYTLAGSPPAGAAIDPDTGAFSWTPTEEQGPATVAFTVRVTDDGVPQLSAERSFTVTVREVDNPPVMEDIVGRSVSEGQLLTFSVSAQDPDNPPQPIRYSLDPGAPEGAVIDPESGVFTWTPSEAQGPGTYPISIRATEAGGAHLSTAQVITVRVIEENDAPVLAAIPDQTVGEGELFAWHVEATDPDIPAQNLTFSLGAGAPEGMTIDPATGWLTWRVPFDHQPAANPVTVRVLDDGSPARTDETTFTIHVEPRTPLVISEVMHHPDQPGAAFVEIRNLSTAREVSLEGLRLVGEALSFDFPVGARAPADGRVVVAANGTAYAAAYRGAPAPVGVWSGTLQAAGDHLRLIRPAQGGQPEELIDEMWFRDSAPWPADATQGGSLQLVDARQDNRRPANWDALAGPPSGEPLRLVDFESVWRYHQLGQDLGTAWREPSYDDAAWPSGPGLLYVENSNLPAPKNTELQIGPLTFYFRTTFRFTGNPAAVNLKLTTIIDDAAVVYLNGRELYRLGMPDGTITFDTRAARVIGNASIEGPFDVPADALVQGDNVLAVEVHQHGLNSSDIVLGIRLEAEAGPLAPATPGEPNSLIGLREPFPGLWINEVQPINATGPTDNAGERAPWIELVNVGPLPAPLDGLFLSDDYADPGEFAFPAGEVLQPGEHRLIWADGQTGQTEPGQVHASFALSGGSGSVLLSRQADHGFEVLDYLDFSGLNPDETMGNLADGDPAGRALLAEPSPGAPNAGAAPNHPPAIEPIDDLAVDEGTAVDFTVSADDPDLPRDRLSFSLGEGAPAGAAIDPATGRFTWTPGEADGPGVYSVTVQVTDAGDPPLTASASFQIEVREVNQPPALEPVADRGALEGTVIEFTARATDPDLPANELTFSLGPGAPAGASIDPVTGLFHWVPGEEAGPGEHAITLVVRDNGDPALEDRQSFHVTVTEVNDPPVIGSIPEPTIPEGIPLQLSIPASDPDLPAQTLTFALGAGAPAGAAIDPVTGVFTWTPGEADGPGQYPVTVIVRDDGVPVRSAEATFTITVTERNRAPSLAAIPDQTVGEGETLRLTLSASDPDLPAQTLRYSLAEGAPAGMVVDPVSGVLTWTPGEADGPAVYTVTAEVMDDGQPPLGDQKTFTVTVTEGNAKPVIAAIGDQTVDEGQELRFTVEATDPDEPAQTLTFSLGAGAPAGAAIDPATGVFTWTPGEADGPGEFPITIVVTDNGSPPRSAQAVVRVTVNEVNSKPQLDQPELMEVDEGSLIEFTLTATDPDLPAQKLTFSLAAGSPEGATIDPDTGLFRWTPTEADGPHQHLVGVVVTDDGQPPRSSGVVVWIRVKEVNRAPVLDPLSAVAASPGETVEVTVTATDPDEPANKLSFALGDGAPAGAVIDPATGALTWTVPADAAGEYAIPIRVTDDGEPPLSATTTLVVRVASQAPRLAVPSLDAQRRLVLRWNGRAGARYVIQVSTNLRDWTERATVEATADEVEWTESETATGPARFYR